ncbi:MAG: glycosyltransferase family 2 protein [Gemmatimonadota bacterium]|nr:glycosyltransferase family 2 protein [Gemmatimonadota bacterium]
MGEPVPGISVVMPAYNEEPVLEQAVRQTLETFAQAGVDHELIVVNDRSTDRTGDVAERLAGQLEAVSCCHHRKNQGVGGAFRTGVAAATRDFVILIPADNPLAPEDLEPFLPRLAECDIVAGVREKRVGYPLPARFGSWVYNRVLVPVLFNIGVPDVNWIQIFRRSIFTEQGISIEYTGIVFLLEILAKARRLGLTICQVPCRMRERLYGKATVFRLNTAWRAFWDMVSLYLKLRRKRNWLR